MDVTPADLEAALRASWTRDSSDDPHLWSPENPAVGQCAVSAIVARAVLGGTMLIGTVLDRDGERTPDGHAWIELPDGTPFDPTFEQFRDGETIDTPFATEPVIDGDPWRAHALAARVAAILGVSIELPTPAEAGWLPVRS